MGGKSGTERALGVDAITVERGSRISPFSPFIRSPRASANPYRPKCGIDTESISEWIRNGQKSIELRRGKCKNGDDAVFQCGSKILRGKIVIKEEGTLKDLLRPDNYKKIIPIANNFEEAVTYLKKIYGNVDGIFTAYTVKF